MRTRDCRAPQVLGFIGWDVARIGRIDSQSDIESCQIGRVMKMQSLAGLVCIVFLGTGCATSHIAHEAKDHCVADPQTGQTTIVPGNKMAWAMAPPPSGGMSPPRRSSDLECCGCGQRSSADDRRSMGHAGPQPRCGWDGVGMRTQGRPRSSANPGLGDATPLALVGWDPIRPHGFGLELGLGLGLGLVPSGA